MERSGPQRDAAELARGGDDRITIVLDLLSDLLIDGHVAILEGYRTRVQLLDILV